MAPDINLPPLPRTEDFNTIGGFQRDRYYAALERWCDEARDAFYALERRMRDA